MKQSLFILALTFILGKFSYSQMLYTAMDSKTELQAKRRIDSLTRFKINSLDSSYYQGLISKLLDTLNQSGNTTLSTSFGLGNIENLDNGFGPFSTGVKFRLTRFKLDKKNWLDPGYVYFEYRTRTGKSADSTILQKTFMFSELNKNDWVIGYFQTYTKNGWTISPLAELSLNKYVNDAKKYFESQNITVGCKLTRNFAPVSSTGFGNWVLFMPYYSLISVDSKFDDYLTVMKETNLPNAFHSIGFLSGFGASNAAFFCNMKYVLNSSKDIISPDLKAIYLYDRCQSNFLFKYFSNLLTKSTNR